MHDISDIAMNIGQQKPIGDANAVFMYFFGAYGTFWTSKFSTGVKNDKGQDMGVKAAMGVWGAALKKYESSTVEAALHRWTSENSDKPPHLPQFLATCAVADKSMGRVPLVALPYEQPPRAAVSLQPAGDGKDWARKILAGIEAGDNRTSTIKRMAASALGRN